MTKSNPVEVVNLYFFVDDGAVDEDLSLRVRLNVNFVLLVVNRAVTRHDTQDIELNVIFLTLFSSYLCLFLLYVIEEHTQQSRVLRHIHDIRVFLFINVLLILR